MNHNHNHKDLRKIIGHETVVVEVCGLPNDNHFRSVNNPSISAYCDGIIVRLPVS